MAPVVASPRPVRRNSRSAAGAHDGNSAGPAQAQRAPEGSLRHQERRVLRHELLRLAADEVAHRLRRVWRDRLQDRARRARLAKQPAQRRGAGSRGRYDGHRAGTVDGMDRRLHVGRNARGRRGIRLSGPTHAALESIGPSRRCR